MADSGDGRGILYPARLPTFHREPAPEELREVIRWFWIARWDLSAGRRSRQEILPFPASNLVIEPLGITLAGPSSGRSHRDLEGAGWVVGALLRPAGLASLCAEPHRIRDAGARFDAPTLLRCVSEVMDAEDEDKSRGRAIAAYGDWALGHLATATEKALLANALEDLIAVDRSILRVDQAAERLGVTTRGIQRLARRYVGLAPLTIIRRYRLQEAAMRLREDPACTIAQVAADLGYADQAHLSADFRRVLGFTASSYRRGGADASA